ncbi:biotin--[acetyl-CoA-carboxylase] ligase [Bombella sp. TMW 2.2559]|uniref:biotin--[biotin carboxyl-carrier protein] ligase n=1 Tax=Bombella dulcis TaxID=2967339 RepID=A0ABT3WAE0_9PROT|nr:biotin--[acetyl-CoA-carboxylase] ligase [Bombella dulcis]MCX5615901.1 biotin--[acetyl-CoA-carboxylase] ligase [Bombella dulcis]
MTWRFEQYETLASTSDLCRERAEAGEKSGLAVLAERQSAARGSRGRGWDSGEGNLAFSFLFHFSDSRDFRAVLPYLASLAFHDGLMAAASCPENLSDRLRVKWPNDLLLSGRKMAGILIETGLSAGGDPSTCWAVIGMGVNLRQAPAIEGRQLAALAEVCSPPDAVSCAHAILHAFDDWMERWKRNGNGVIWEGWMKRAHPVGTRLILRRHGRETAGRFAGLDAQGHLLLTLDGGAVISVVTGDVICE